MRGTLVLVAFGAFMAVPAAAQTDVGTSTRPGRLSSLDTMRAMLQRRNPTIDEVLSFSAEVRRKLDQWRMVNERARRELATVDEMRRREMQMQMTQVIDEVLSSQRLLAEACALIRPHQGESEAVLGFQVANGLAFQQTAPLVKEERFVRPPEITYVEPNTPAEKAGIREGDLWIGIAGRDLVNTYVRELNDVLKPDTRVELKIRRDGRELNVEVVARKRREFPQTACTTDMFQIHAIGPDRPKIQIFGGAAPPARTEFFTMKITKASFSGAIFAELTSAKREMLKVKLSENEGVIVDAVAAGSHAEAVGLREWDIVTRANHEVIESLADLTRIMQSNSQVTLWVVRPEGSRKVILPGGR
jgi:hypothetical protein